MPRGRRSSFYKSENSESLQNDGVCGAHRWSPISCSGTHRGDGRTLHPKDGCNFIRVRDSQPIRSENSADSACTRPFIIRREGEKTILRFGGSLFRRDCKRRRPGVSRKDVDYPPGLEWPGNSANFFLLEGGRADRPRSCATSRSNV